MLNTLSRSSLVFQQLLLRARSKSGEYLLRHAHEQTKKTSNNVLCGRPRFLIEEEAVDIVSGGASHSRKACTFRRMFQLLFFCITCVVYRTISFDFTVQNACTQRYVVVSMVLLTLSCLSSVAD
jgi:hypothetical protein